MKDSPGKSTSVSGRRSRTKVRSGRSGKISRRTILKGSALAVAAPLVLPRSVFGANERVNLAWVGFNNMGWNDLRSCASDNDVVALCDCNKAVWGKAKNKFPKAKFYQDFRKMLDEMGDKIDGVGVGTPDHNHFAVTYKAMNMGKHVFVEKPLVHSLWECRTLQELAKKKGVITQMGNQGHAWEQARMIKEWYEAGLIGDVKEVHAWTGRPAGGWGFPKHPAGGMKKYADTQPTPDGQDWDLWLGPITKKIGYSDTYLGRQGNWRPWWDFGCGGLGDIGCHTIDAPWWALGLGAPLSVEVEMAHPGNNLYTPDGSVVTYKFPARGKQPPVSIKWYEGPARPEKPAGFDEKIGKDGMIMVGTKGGIVHSGMRPRGVRLYPKQKWDEYKSNVAGRVPKTLPRVKGIHDDWINGIKTGKTTCSDFSYSGPLTEVILLGTLAIRSGQNLEWDSKNLKVKNNPAADELVQIPARKGWNPEEL